MAGIPAVCSKNKSKLGEMTKQEVVSFIAQLDFKKVAYKEATEQLLAAKSIDPSTYKHPGQIIGGIRRRYKALMNAGDVETMYLAKEAGLVFMPSDEELAALAQYTQAKNQE